MERKLQVRTFEHILYYKSVCLVLCNRAERCLIFHNQFEEVYVQVDQVLNSWDGWVDRGINVCTSGRRGLATASFAKFDAAEDHDKLTYDILWSVRGDKLLKVYLKSTHNS